MAIGRDTRLGCGCVWLWLVADVRGREAHPDDPPPAGGLASALDLAEAAARARYRRQDLRVDVQRLDSAPAGGAAGGAAQALGDERARVWDVGETRVDGERAGVVHEVVDGLYVGCGVARG